MTPPALVAEPKADTPLAPRSDDKYPLPSPPASHNTAPAPVKGHGERVLVVEDDESLQQVLVRVLQALNYQVLAAGNGREALTILQQCQQGKPERIALLLTDLMMPEMDGDELIQAVQECAWTLPIVVLTGYPPSQAKSETLRRAGVVSWLQKPVGMEQLAQVVAQVLTPPPLDSKKLGD